MVGGEGRRGFGGRKRARKEREEDEEDGCAVMMMVGEVRGGIFVQDCLSVLE